uniref:Ig-like domain-containing protein n=2 Tax=Astyanax mexicanus TaxID=7994 RepID=A0A3B1JDN6_ASTMX
MLEPNHIRRDPSVFFLQRDDQFIRHQCLSWRRGTMMITVVISFCLFVTVKMSNDDLQVQTEKIGENVVIKCEQSFIKDNHQNSYAWFKQSYGKLPQLVVRLVNNNSNVRYNRQFQQRFNTTLKGDQFVLNIQETVEEDSGTYFCVRVKTDITEFGSGTLLIFNEEKTQKGNLTELKVKSGKSAGSLQCSVLMATLSCSGDHSVYWFRPDSGEPRPGIIFTHGDSSSPCTRSSEEGRNVDLLLIYLLLLVDSLLGNLIH